MFTLHLVRHGETTEAASGVFSGDIDPPLTPRGHDQAQKVARALAPLDLKALYVSPKLRARQTIEPVATLLGLTPVVEPALKEIGYGRWEGERERDVRVREPDAYQRWVDDPGLVAPPGGETGFAIAARAMPAITAIRDRHPDANVLIVSHKATIRVIVCALLGMYIGRFRDRIDCPPASLTTFVFGDRGPLLTRLADTSHLAP